MPACLWLAALSLGLAADGLAPVGVSVPAEGTRLDMVARVEGTLVGEVPLRLLISDRATDAPVSDASLSLRLFGPLGTDPIEVSARPGELPGHYLAAVHFPSAGHYAAAARVTWRGAVELLALSGIAIEAAPEAPSGFPIWPGLLVTVLLLAGLAVWRGRRPPAAAALLLAWVAAGDARAHGTPPPAAVPGAEAYLAQEIQFFLGTRTEPARVETFEGERSGGEAARQDLGVPRSAVLERDGHKLIFVRTAPEHFVAREAKLGRANLSTGRVAVLSGLSPGDRVVVEGAAFLRNGGAQTP